MTLYDAYQEAREIAQLPDWAEAHIERNTYADRIRCSCSICFWRELHARSILVREHE